VGFGLGGMERAGVGKGWGLEGGWGIGAGFQVLSRHPVVTLRVHSWVRVRVRVGLGYG
jgi:hypothetical protein